MHRVRGLRRFGVVGMVVAAGMAVSAPTASGEFGDARILAPFPSDPGFPEGIAVRKEQVFAAGAATFGTTGAGPSAVVAYDRDSGELLRRYDAVGEDLTTEHANSSIAFDRTGRLYVLNTQLGIYRLNPKTGKQEAYSEPFPDLPPCPLVPTTPCSPTPANQPPIPNDIAFAPDGSAYVSDSMQATIWRIPRGGGEPQIWFQDERFASAYIGTNGLRLKPDGTHVYVTVTADLDGVPFLYSLRLVERPKAEDLDPLYRFRVGEVPDGIAFGANDEVYVAMATPDASGVLILRPDGREAVARLGNPAGSLTHPYDGPANIAFDGAGRVLLTNHAPFTSLALRRFSIVDVDVEDRGSALFTPAVP